MLFLQQFTAIMNFKASSFDVCTIYIIVYSGITPIKTADINDMMANNQSLGVQ